MMVTMILIQNGYGLSRFGHRLRRSYDVSWVSLELHCGIWAPNIRVS